MFVLTFVWACKTCFLNFSFFWSSFVPLEPCGQCKSLWSLLSLPSSITSKSCSFSTSPDVKSWSGVLHLVGGGRLICLHGIWPLRQLLQQKPIVQKQKWSILWVLELVKLQSFWKNTLQGSPKFVQSKYKIVALNKFCNVIFYGTPFCF